MRILFVGFSQSIHVARWLKQLADQGWDLHIFPSNYAWRPFAHKDLRDVTLHGLWSLARPRGADPSVRLRGFSLLQRGSWLLSKVFRHIFPRRYQPEAKLCQLIRELKPDLVHSLEIQHSGYLTLKAKKMFGAGFPPWLVTNYGSDIFFFGRLKNHRDQIKEVLASCDYYSCECHRDVDLARKFGFQGPILPVFPNTGGFNLERLEQLRAPGPTSSRRLIVLKGYQHMFGRALTGLRALELCADVLKDYRVAMYLTADDVQMAAEIMADETGIPIDFIPYTMNHEDMLRLHGRARISIGLNASDGVSTSFLEALVMGSFPIQSNTAAAHEWIKDGETGVIVHPQDPQAVAAAIRRAVTDDTLVDRAAAENWQTARARLNYHNLKAQVVDVYKNLLTNQTPAQAA